MATPLKNTQIFISKGLSNFSSGQAALETKGEAIKQTVKKRSEKGAFRSVGNEALETIMEDDENEK